MPMTKEMGEAIDRWMDKCQTLITNEYRERYKNLDIPKLIIAGGTKYLKIQEESIGGSSIRPEKRWSAYAFIDLTNGDILKPATWKQPAKHARGNLFDEHDGMKYMTTHGPMYMETIKEMN